MREFPQDALASVLLERGELGRPDIDALAARVAAFHAAIDVATAAGTFGTPDGILRLAQRNFAEIDPLLSIEAERREMEAIRAWAEREHASRRDAFERRRAQGFVRECHGDLHLGNIARIDGELVIFDCIEFNEEMRWIDVMSEVAFTVMDLEDRARAGSRASLSERVSRAHGRLRGARGAERSISRTARWFAPRWRCSGRRRPAVARARRGPSRAAICGSHRDTRSRRGRRSS